MFCSKCGKQHDGDGYFCPECSAKEAAASGAFFRAPVGFGGEAAEIVTPAAPAAPAAAAPAAEYTAPAAAYAAPAAAYTAPVAPAAEYTAPAAAYAAPAAAYTAPVAPAAEYTAPAAAYAAPAAAYTAPVAPAAEYTAPAAAYAAPAAAYTAPVAPAAEHTDPAAAYAAPAAAYTAPVAPAAEYTAPAAAYTAPAAAYTAPVAPAAEYTAPAAAYTAPAAAYTAPTGEYTAPAAAYTAPTAPVGESAPGFTLSAAADAAKKPAKKSAKKSTKKSSKKKKKGLLIGLGVVALVLIVGAVLLALNWNSLFGGKDGGKEGGKANVKVPEDPGEYIAFLHEPQLEGISKRFSEFYGNYMGSSNVGTSMDANLKLILGDDLLESISDSLADSGMEMDAQWLKEITLKFHINAPDMDAMDMSLALAVGKQDIVGLDYVLDLENLMAYMAIPQLNKTYMKLDMNTAMGQELPFEQMVAISEQLAKDMPSEKEMEKLLNGYGEIILSYMTDVEMSEETVAVGDLEQEVTVLTVTLSEKQLAQMLGEMLEYTKDNKTARKIAQAYVNYTNAYSDLDYYEEPIYASMDDFDDFIDEGIETMEQMEEEAQKGSYLNLITYADGADILGFTLKVFTDEELDGELGYLALTEKDVICLEAKIDDGYEPITFVGEGKLSKGKLTGEYVLEADGDEVLTLKLKNVDTTTGYGEYELCPSAMLMDELDLEGMLGTVASSCSLKVELSEGELGLTLMAGKKELVGLELSVSRGKASKVSIPKNAVDMEDESDLQEWLEDMDFMTVLDNLKKAGLPKDLYNQLKLALALS